MKKEVISTRINSLFESINKLNFEFKKDDITFIKKVINKIDSGEIRSSEKTDGEWIVNDFVKKAILLYIKFGQSSVISADFNQYLHADSIDIYYYANNIGEKFSCVDNSFGMKYYDKIPLKFANFTEKDFTELGSRIVPGAIVRFGSFIGKNTVIMPSFINIGAYVGERTMIDAWSTIGSCAQIGKNCHISGGVGIGGVLEPATALPVIIEDNVFIGARSEIAEGVIVGEGSIISMGVYIGASTKIVDRGTGEIFYGKVPAGSVVVSGTSPSSGNTNLYAAIIIKKVDTKAKSKTAINEILREA
jgi:2,3,4,5-tetrahydropyridine-2-carboxylate N-succinyltransferase